MMSRKYFVNSSGDYTRWSLNPLAANPVPIDGLSEDLSQVFFSGWHLVEVKVFKLNDVQIKGVISDRLLKGNVLEDCVQRFNQWFKRKTRCLTKLRRKNLISILAFWSHSLKNWNWVLWLAETAMYTTTLPPTTAPPPPTNQDNMGGKNTYTKIRSEIVNM